MHTVYIMTITIFVKNVYAENDEQFKTYYLFIMNLGILYPLVYDTIQMKKLGIRNYFSEFWNYTDFFFIWTGFVNIFTQYMSDSHNFGNKVL